jgi:hypothetical protein
MENHTQKPRPMSHENSLKKLAEQRALILIGCFRKADAADPEIYARAVVAVLLRWPVDVIKAVTEPATGIPSKINWLPSIAEITTACEEAYAPIQRQREREQALKRLPAPEVKRLSNDELDAQFERLGLAHLRPGSKFGARPSRFSDNEARQAQATLDRYAAEATQQPMKEAAE